MKVVVVDPWFFTPPYDRELCEGLASTGHEVVLIGQNQGDGLDDRNRSELSFSILGLFIPPSSGLPRFLLLLAKGARHWQGLIKSLLMLRRLQPDVIHLQWLSLPLVDALFIPLFRRIAPVILTVHDSNPYNGAGPLLLRFGNGLALRRCDRWIVHNELSETRLAVQGLPVERIHRIAHGLLGRQTGIRRQPRDRADKRIHLLQFGKLKDYKGVDVLLKALGSFDEALRSRCRVSIVGRPYLDTQPLHDLMRHHQLQSFVDLRLDFVSDNDMAALFDDADILVFPYRDIDTSGVLMAAIADAIPVVASDIGCFSEMLTNGKEGRLVPPDDPEALAATLADLVEKPEKIQAMREEMLALRQRIPSWQRIAEQTTEVYELVQARPAPRAIGAAV